MGCFRGLHFVFVRMVLGSPIGSVTVSFLKYIHIYKTKRGVIVPCLCPYDSRCLTMDSGRCLGVVGSL
jgi:hypothetical protein